MIAASIISAIAATASAKTIPTAPTMREVDYEATFNDFKTPPQEVHDSKSTSDPTSAAAASLHVGAIRKGTSLPGELSKSEFDVSAVSAFGKLGVAISGSTLSTNLNQSLLLKVEATAQTNDKWMVVSKNKALNDGTHHVIEHGSLTLSGSFQAHASGPNNSDKDFSNSGAGIGVFVEGTGVTLPDGIAGSTSASVCHSGCRPPNDTPLVKVVNYTLDMTYGKSEDINISLRLDANSLSQNFSSVTNSPTSSDFSGDFIHTLAWNSGMYFTDEDGNALNPDDFTFSAASGFDYMHPTFGTGSVPEPASWALMLGGFGMMGSAMRRAKRKTVAFQAV